MSELLSYDLIPYPSKFFMQTHPERLATNAFVFGLAPPDVATCRVLELGCGNGSNLIAQAFTMPDARFVGVDLAPNHIDDAKRMAAELGLANVEFHALDLTEMSVGTFGKFDYVTAHGLFSWVPDFVRDRVLPLCRELLNDNGIGYISYAANPGSWQRKVVQQIMRRRTRDIAAPLEKVTEAMSFVAFLHDNAAGDEIYAAVLRNETRRQADVEPADILHDDLADFNNAFFVEEFASRLAENGLRFLAEAELHAMGTHGLSADARAFVDALDDIVEREQNLDFLRGRAFRQTLFCHAALTPNHRPTPAVVKSLMIASSIRPLSSDVELASQKREKFVGANGLVIEIDHPPTKAALTILGEEWGRAIHFDELIALASARIGAEIAGADADVTASVLFQIARGTSLVELHSFQPRAEQKLSARPRVSRLAAQQLASARNVLTLLNLDVKIDDPISRRLLEVSDGTRDVGAIVAALGEFLETADEFDRRDAPDNLDAWVRESLEMLARLGMFEA